jgi:hypothetical protein
MAFKRNRNMGKSRIGTGYCVRRTDSAGKERWCALIPSIPAESAQAGSSEKQVN